MFIRYLFLVAWIGLIIPDSVAQDLDRSYDPSWNFSPEERDVIEKRRRLLLWGPTTKIENRSAKLHFVNFTLAKSDFLRSLDSLKLLMSTDPMTT